ncbi:MAG TPA: hypothetical protein VKA21_06905 [Candidatus Binatia bacterium]|nr:hypothetical protein [Candidatus Binatia bacterium]
MRGWTVVLALAAAIAVGACGVDKPRAERPDEPEYSADRLDLADQDSILDVLDEEERAAVDRAGMTGARPARDEVEPAPEEESKADTAGKVGISFLSVALTVGAAVAPFFLF